MEAEAELGSAGHIASGGQSKCLLAPETRDKSAFSHDAGESDQNVRERNMPPLRKICAKSTAAAQIDASSVFGEEPFKSVGNACRLCRTVYSRYTLILLLGDLRRVPGGAETTWL